MNAQPAIKRRIGVGLLALCATLLTSACAAGQLAQTANEVPAIDGTSGGVGALQLHAVAIKSPAGATAYSAGDAAELQLVIVNTGHNDDTLASVSTPAASAFHVFASAAEASAANSPSASSSASASGSASSSATASAVSLVVPAGRTLSLGVVETDPVLLLRLSKTLFPGPSVAITFTFAKAGAVTIAVPVQLSANSSSLGVSIAPPSSSAAG